MDSAEFWKKLTEPFHPDDIQWMPKATSKSGRAMLLAYVSRPAILDRLDTVCGPDGWRAEYQSGPDGGIECRLWIRCPDDEWRCKVDIAENTKIEAVKGGFSGSLKRAASTWGIGRYLYYLGESWQAIKDGSPPKGGVSVKGKSQWFYPPPLPSWALPGGSGRPNRDSVHDERARLEEPAEPEAQPQGEAREPSPSTESVRRTARAWVAREIRNAVLEQGLPELSDDDMRSLLAWLATKKGDPADWPDELREKLRDNIAATLDAWRVAAGKTPKKDTQGDGQRWTKQQQDRFQARFKALWSEIQHPPDYDNLKGWLASIGRHKPSVMDEATRGQLLDYLRSQAGAQQFLIWTARNRDENNRG